MGKLLTMYGIEASINTAAAGAEETWSELAEGFDNISEALNETVQQYFFLKDKGFASNHVTGMAPAFTLTGRRVLGDAAQDYIFGKKYKLDGERDTNFKLTYADNAGATVTLTCPVSLCNIQEWSGAATDDSAVSVEIRFNGKPEVTTTPKA